MYRQLKKLHHPYEKILRHSFIKPLLLLSTINSLIFTVSCGTVEKFDNSSPVTPVITTNTTTESIETITSATSIITADPDDINTITSISLDKNEVFIKVGDTDMPLVTMKPESSTEKEEKWVSSDEKIAVVDSLGNIKGVSPGTCYVTVTSVNNPLVYAEVKVTVTSDITSSVETTTASTSENKNETMYETYVQGILIANKSYALPKNYNPGLDPETKSQFDLLTAEAAKEGLNIWLASGFRSYDYQKQIYTNYVNSYGQSTADTFSARPGHSEHQTGLAIDVNSIDDTFAGTPEALWLEKHAHEFGFIIRYPKGKEHITGYKYEPWHLRYLGKSVASDVYNSGLTLEEYLGIDSKYR